MTKSEMQWEDNLDTERASSIARRFVIEDLALQYRTSLQTAEKLLATDIGAERQPRCKEPTSPDVIEIDKSPRKVKVEVAQEDMDVDIEGEGSNREFSFENNAQQEQNRFQPIERPPIDPPGSSYCPKQPFVFSTISKSTNPVRPFSHRHSYPSLRFSSQMWPYSTTYPYMTTKGAFARSYPLLHGTAGSKNIPSYLPIELIRNRYHWAQSAQEASLEEKPRVFHTPEKRTQVFPPPEQRPWTFMSPEKESRTFASSEESSQRERPRVSTFEDEKVRFLYQKKPPVFTFEREQSQRYEDQTRSYTPPGTGIFTTGRPKSNTLKPRRHSDDEVTNFNRPSVIVMQRSLSNPATPGKEHRHETNCGQCTCTDDHHSTDSDSSATPPLAQEESSSNNDNKGKIKGAFIIRNLLTLFRNMILERSSIYIQLVQIFMDQ